MAKTRILVQRRKALRSHRVTKQQLSGQLAQRDQADGHQHADHADTRAYPHALKVYARKASR